MKRNARLKEFMLWTVFIGFLFSPETLKEYVLVIICALAITSAGYS